MTPNAPKSTRSAEMNAPKTKELAGNHSILVRPMVMPPIVTSTFAGVEVKVISIKPLGTGADKTLGWGDVGTSAALGVNVLAIGAPPLPTVVVL